MKKLIFIQNTILHYRKSFYNRLAEKYNVTVIHSGKCSVSKQDKYDEIIIPVSKTGPFYLQNSLVETVKKINPDFVVAMFDIRWLNTFRLLKKTNVRYKFLWWGLDIGKSNFATRLKVYISRLGFPIIFYNEYNRDKMALLNLGSSQLFVANNTFDVGKRNRSYLNPVKNKILFVGSFDQRKRNDLLIIAFSEIVSKIPKNIELVFIGDGAEKSNSEFLVEELSLTDRIKFEGRIDDPVTLSTYYDEAIVSVSYGQAGLSVLQSLGFGVPYITKVNAISGGEISNITHEKTGYFCQDNIESLKEYILKLALNVGLARELGENSYEYYTKYCTVDNMADGFDTALKGIR